MMNDLRYAVRTLLRNPGFAVVALLTLALGIGANTAIFSVVNGVLLRPLPFADPDRIVRVWTTTRNVRRSNHSAGDFIDIQRENRTLVAIAGYRADAFTVSDRGGQPTQVEGSHVTTDFFDVFGVAARIGRTFSRSIDGSTAARLVILSHSTWHEIFGGDAAIAGSAIRLNGEAHTVVGVMPDGFAWPSGARIWKLSPKPVPPSPLEGAEAPTNRDMRYFEAVARLKPGVTLATALVTAVLFGVTPALHASRAKVSLAEGSGRGGRWHASSRPFRPGRCRSRAHPRAPGRRRTPLQ